MTRSKIEGIEITQYWKKETKNETLYSINYLLPEGEGIKRSGQANCRLLNNELVLTLPDNCFTKEFLEYKDELMEYINDYMKFPLIIGVQEIEDDDD